MPVFIEFSAPLPSHQDLTDLEKIYAEMPADLLPPFTSPEALLDQALQQQCLLVARFNGRLLGAALLMREAARWQLSHLCVRKITRQRGVARRILEETRCQAIEQNAQLVLSIPQQLDTIRQWAITNNYTVQLSNKSSSATLER